MEENEQNMENENSENVLENKEENSTNNIVSNTEGDTNEITLEDVQAMEEEKLEEYSGLGEPFLISLFVLVLISMIFEAAIRFLRTRIFEKQEREKDTTMGKKWLSRIHVT